MSKSKKGAKRKQQALTEAATDRKRLKIPLSPDSSDHGDRHEPPPTSLRAIVSEEEVEVAVDTLRTLAAHPTMVKTKACKDLRTAVYDFRQACTTGVNNTSTATETNLTARISAALVDEKFSDALIALAEMRIRNQAPKLGALCRWVRDLDVTSGFSMGKDAQTGRVERTKGQLERLKILDAISRVTGTVDLVPRVEYTKSEDPFILHPEWRPCERVAEKRVGSELRTGSLDGIKDKFRVLERTQGADRKPPNLHDAVLYLSENATIPLPASKTDIKHHRHPAVPNLSLMQDVLSVEECETIVATMETVGFLPDAPVRDDGSEASILAHNVYWIIDQAFHDALWARVAPFVPHEVEGRKARGINRRFRVYRYVPGAEYRVHFDGAWPPSGIDAQTGKYQWDSSPPEARQSSLFTFLVYLNDDFEGGETTFFTPSLIDGVMNAHPVRPVRGSIALFPHGESKGALLHEGTGVTRGAKYIIRTDVEYDVDCGRD